MIIPMLCVTIFVILVVWFLLPRVARLMIHTPTAISIFVCLSMVQLMAVFISMRCTLCGHFLQVALTLILVVGRSEERFSRNAETDLVCRLLLEKKKAAGRGRVHLNILRFRALDGQLPPRTHGRNPSRMPGLLKAPHFGCRNDSCLGPARSRADFFFSSYRDHRDLHSFPTRRSSDLNGRLHFHAVHFMRTLPTGSVDPNFGRRVRNRRQLNSLQNTWPYGYSMPIAVRYPQDAFSRSGWLWPVDAKGEPLKATSY